MIIGWKSNLLLANETTRLAYRCEVCPCDDGGWYIVGLCPCPVCGQVGPCFVGVGVSVGGETVRFDYGPNQDVLPLTVLKLNKVLCEDAAQSDGQTEPFEVQAYLIGCIVVAVWHAATAPFDGATITAKTVIDGVLFDTWTSGPYSKDTVVQIGDGVSGGSTPDYKCVEVLKELTEAKNYIFDMKIEWTANGETPVRYTARKVIQSVSTNAELLSDTAWIGAVGVIPEKINKEDSCEFNGEEPETSLPVRMFPKVLKGPFDTKADADYVLETFGDLIDCYAATCLCVPTCRTGAFIADNALYYEELGMGILEELAAGDNAEYRCDFDWAKYSIVFDEERAELEGYTLTPKIKNPDGTIVDAPLDGLLPPCHTIFIRIDGVELPYGFSDGSPINGNFSPVNSTDDCCIEDESSPHYGEAWDYADGEGVPSNSVELADYLESLQV